MINILARRSIHRWCICHHYRDHDPILGWNHESWLYRPILAMPNEPKNQKGNKEKQTETQENRFACKVSLLYLYERDPNQNTPKQVLYLNQFSHFSTVSQQFPLWFLAHLGYIPLSLYNHDSQFHHYMGSWTWHCWHIWCLCMLLLARVLILQTLYFADISHNIFSWCTWNI